MRGIWSVLAVITARNSHLNVLMDVFLFIDNIISRTKMEPYSPEYTVVSNCTSKLEKALKDNRDIVHFLECNNFISKDIHDTVLSATCPLTTLEKSGKLVEKIRDKVELNSKNFYVLMKEFNSHKEIYQDIIDILELEMKRQGITITACKISGEYVW